MIRLVRTAPENEASVINRLPLTAFTVIVVALLSVTTHAAGQEYSAQLTGSAVVPPVSSAATGVFVATLDTQTRTFSYTLEFKGLSSSEGSAYIQGPAAKGTNAAMAVFPISKAGVPLPASPIRATVTLTDNQMKELQSNLWYVVIHTSAFPNGEIRGQIMKKLKPAKGAAGKQK